MPIFNAKNITYTANNDVQLEDLTRIVSHAVDGEDVLKQEVFIARHLADGSVAIVTASIDNESDRCGLNTLTVSDPDISTTSQIYNFVAAAIPTMVINNLSVSIDTFKTSIIIRD